MAMSVGGDGTFLRTASAIGDRGIPILGINTGRLGFLTGVNYHELDDILPEIVEKNTESKNVLYWKSTQKKIPILSIMSVL